MCLPSLAQISLSPAKSSSALKPLSQPLKGATSVKILMIIFSGLQSLLVRYLLYIEYQVQTRDTFTQVKSTVFCVNMRQLRCISYERHHCSLKLPNSTWSHSPLHLPLVATLGVPCYMSLSSPPYMRHHHSSISPLSSSLSMTWWIGMTKTLCPHIWSLCSSVALPLIYLSPQIDISHPCPISVNHSAFCTSPQYQSRDYQFSSLSVSTIYTGSHTRRNQCSSCFFFACSLTLISPLIKLSQAFRLTSIIFFCNCQHM